MTGSEAKLSALDDRIQAAQGSLNKDRLRRDELEVSICAQQSALRDLVEERRTLKAHVDRVRTVVRRVA